MYELFRVYHKYISLHLNTLLLVLDVYSPVLGGKPYCFLQGDRAKHSYLRSPSGLNCQWVFLCGESDHEAESVFLKTMRFQYFKREVRASRPDIFVSYEVTLRHGLGKERATSTPSNLVKIATP